MSRRFSSNLLTSDDRRYIESTLKLDEVECFREIDGAVYAPFAFGRQRFVGPIERPPDRCEGEPAPTFVGQLRPDQATVARFCERTLNETGSVVISARPGFGKTITAIYVACLFGARRVAIVVNKLILVDQWIAAVEEFTASERCSYVKSTTIDPPSTTFCVVNAVNAGKKPEGFWDSIDFVIVDELHQIVTKVLSKSLLRFTPRFLIGLSATPYRFDEYDAAIEWFFGSNVIGKRLSVDHVVRVIRTGFRPERLKYTRKGLDWNAVLTDQSEDDRRNGVIVDSILAEPDRVWLVLVKRVAHAELLKRMIDERSTSKRCATLVGSATKFDATVDVLIGTTSKVGVGFDHAAVDALCIAADVKNYFVQFLGRCMRRENCRPLVIDFKDDFGPLDRHLEYRLTEYRRYGGKIIVD